MSSLKAKRSSRTEAPDPTPAAQPAEVIIGRFVGTAEDGAPLVDFPANPAGIPVPALATARYELVPADAPVALMFLAGDRARPLAIGLIARRDEGEGPLDEAPIVAQPDERFTLTAAREIVLQCGRASIVLTRAGKVLVRGAYVSLRSSGMQRITGASVQIN
jgi:hypothetical protein